MPSALRSATSCTMTPQALLAASKGEAKAVAAGSSYACAFSDGHKPFAVVAHKQIGNFAFEVVFCSDPTGKLASVALEPDTAKYVEIRAALLSTYGAPVSDGSGDIAVTAWTDKKTGNFVRLIKVLDHARIEYRAIATGL